MFQSHPENVTVRVIRRTSLEELADLLIAELAADFRSHASGGADGGTGSAGGLFYRPEVIAPNKSMRRYLTMRFAGAEGIAAGIRFPSLMSLFPAERIDEASIGWRVYRILQSEPAGTFPALENWSRGDGKRRYELACQLGRLYYQYMLYRPDWLNAWERNAVPEDLRGVKDADWQGELWRRTAGGDWKGRHFAAGYARTIRGETDGRRRRIRIFGFSQLAPAVMECLAWFSCTDRADVKIYQLVPSRGKYFDEKNQSLKDELKELVHLHCHTGEDPARLEYLMSNLYFQHNPLIASFGMQSRTAMTEAETLEFRGTDDEGESEETGDDGNDTLLHRLQRRIRADAPGRADGAGTARGPEAACPSIQFRSCYSAFREVEAAHNFILHCLDEDPELTLNDIFIMTPKPETFSPLVDAVFNHSSEGRLAVSLADRPRTDELPAWRTFLNILSLFKGDFTATEVFDIMQDAAVQARLGVTGDECREFRRIAMRAGIRWGWDASDHKRESSGGRAFPQNTWQAGFDRMLLSYAADIDPAAPFPAGPPGEDGEPRNLYAVPGYSGGRAVTLGKLACLVRRLHDFAVMMRSRAETGVPFRVWKETLTRAAADFFGAESDLSLLLLEVLAGWGDVLNRACAAEDGVEDAVGDGETDDTPLNGETVLSYLRNQVPDGGDSTRGFLRGSITFCGLRPMRSIPAGVIVLLGMDHRSFPGDDSEPEFDLMRKKRRVGDPDRREESRQLFLDVLLAARKYFYLSYVGRDNHDRKEFPPSVCAEVLRAYLEREFGKNCFVDIREPLQSFSPELFTPGRRNQSYSRKLLEAARKVRADRTREIRPVFELGEVPQAPDGPPMEISTEDLLRFLRDPAGEFVRKRLDAFVSVFVEAPPEDSESFQSGLDFERKKELFDLYLRTSPGRRGDLARISLERMKADGAAPLTQKPDSWDAWARIAAMGDFMESETGAAEKTSLPQTEKRFACGVTLTLPEQEAYVSGEGACLQVIPCLAKEITANLMLHAIVAHLGANLRRETVTRILWIREGRTMENRRFEASAMSPCDAEEVMNGILELYCEGMRGPIPFFPATLYAMSQNIDGCESAWTGSYGVPGEAGKFGLFFGDELPPRDELEPLMRTVFGNDKCRFAERSSAE